MNIGKYIKTDETVKLYLSGGINKFKMKKLILMLGAIINSSFVAFSQFQECFSLPNTYTVDVNITGLTSADFNGDGKIDLATPTKLLSGNGDGSFAVSAIPNISNTSSRLVSADFNNDGKKDLAMTEDDFIDGDLRVLVLMGNGSGGFSSPVKTNPAMASIHNMVSADFNNDGKIDLAVISDTELKLLLGNGAGGFSVSTVNTLTGTHLFWSIAAADFNGDGRIDLATTKSIGDYFPNATGHLSVFYRNTSGGFSAPVEIAATPVSRSITAADLNNDGKMDLASACVKGFVVIALGNGAGTFSVKNIQNELGAVDYDFITTGDYNNDGRLDLVLSQNVAGVTYVWLENGNGNYTTNGAGYSVTAVGQALMAVSADFNGDGKLDLATPNYSDPWGLVGMVNVFLGTIHINTSQTNVTTCYGGKNGTATAIASCGTNFSYSWNTSPVQNTATATGLSAGTYTVIVTQGKATNYATVTITQPQEISINQSSVNESCIDGGKNGSATIDVEGGTPPYSYSWNTSPKQTTQTASDLAAGKYTVTVTDTNGCVKSSDVQVDYDPNPSSFSFTSNGMVVSFSRTGIGCNTFVWDFGNGNTSTINPNPTVTYLAAGTYGVCLQCNGQPAECIQCLNITVPSNTTGGTSTGIEEAQLLSQIQVYPNPTNDFITIENKSIKSGSTYTILNSIGQVVLAGHITGFNTTIHVNLLPPGLYLLQVGETEKHSFRVFKN